MTKELLLSNVIQLMRLSLTMFLPPILAIQNVFEILSKFRIVIAFYYGFAKKNNIP